jgi:hypothetical protein
MDVDIVSVREHESRNHAFTNVKKLTSFWQDRKFHTATFRQEIVSGRKSHKGTWYQDILTDWLTVVK